MSEHLKGRVQPRQCFFQKKLGFVNQNVCISMSCCTWKLKCMNGVRGVPKRKKKNLPDSLVTQPLPFFTSTNQVASFPSGPSFTWKAKTPPIFLTSFAPSCRRTKKPFEHPNVADREQLYATPSSPSQAARTGILSGSGETINRGGSLRPSLWSLSLTWECLVSTPACDWLGVEFVLWVLFHVCNHYIFIIMLTRLLVCRPEPQYPGERAAFHVHTLPTWHRACLSVKALVAALKCTVWFVMSSGGFRYGENGIWISYMVATF